MKTSLLFASAVLGSCLSQAEIVVDGNLPAGNIIVESVTDDVVKVRQDMRDSNNWFYWAFRVRGAEGRTVRFDFTNPYAKGPVSCRGPAVTRDKGETWSYAAEGRSSTSNFVYTFAADEKETWFYHTFQYLPSHWEAFLARHADKRGTYFESSVLCKSRKGRDVPKARFGRLDGQAKYRVWLSSRTHAGEAQGTYVVEGWLERVFGDDALGAWLRENVEFMVVPFVDFDGVVDGDQGKGRKPHDHNRDYVAFLYPESKAIAEWLTTHAQKKVDVFVDCHCPFVRDQYNERVYQTHHADKWNTAAKIRWGRLLEKHQTGSMAYRMTNDYAWGFGWNGPKNTASKPGQVPLMGLGGWAQKNITNLLICTTYEVPFANASGKTVTPQSCRELGASSAAVLKDFLLKADRKECSATLGDPTEWLGLSPAASLYRSWDIYWGRRGPKPCAADFTQRSNEIRLRSSFASADEAVTIVYARENDTPLTLTLTPQDEEVTIGSRVVKLKAEKLAVSGVGTRPGVCVRSRPSLAQPSLYSDDERAKIFAAYPTLEKLSDLTFIIQTFALGANHYYVLINGQMVAEFTSPTPIKSVAVSGQNAETRNWSPKLRDANAKTFSLSFPSGGFALARARPTKETRLQTNLGEMPNECFFPVPKKRWARVKVLCGVDALAPDSAEPIVTVRLLAGSAGEGKAAVAFEKTIDLRKDAACIVPKEHGLSEVTFDLDAKPGSAWLTEPSELPRSLQLEFLGDVGVNAKRSSLVLYEGCLEPAAE